VEGVGQTKKSWGVYIVQCKDKTLYTGISNDIKKRVKKHNSGKGAKYIVPARRPVKLVFVEEGMAVGEAMKRERKIKQMQKSRKKRLIKEYRLGRKESKNRQ
jgi:putative endonuclease